MTCRCHRSTTAFRGSPADPERLVALADRWGLDSPLDRMLAALEAAPAG